MCFSSRRALLVVTACGFVLMYSLSYLIVSWGEAWSHIVLHNLCTQDQTVYTMTFNSAVFGNLDHQFLRSQESFEKIVR